MEELVSLLESNPQITEIDLSDRQLQTIQDLIPYLQQFQKLDTLLLQDNILDQLPQDLSSLEFLVKLDITNNFFESVQQLIPSLQTLPALKILNIDIHETEDNQLLLQFLGLSQLNGVIHEAQVNKKEEEFSQIDFVPQSDFLTEDIQTAKQVCSKIPGTSQQLKEKIVKILQELTEVINQEKPKHVVQIHTLKQKIGIYDFCIEKLGDFITETQIKQQFARVTANLKHCVQELVELALSEKNVVGVNQFQATLKEQLESMQSEIEDLQAQNKRYLQTIINYSKKSASSTLSSTRTPPVKYSFKTQTLNPKRLTFKQVHSVIKSLLSSKIRHNQKTTDNQTPRQTLQKFLYTFLRQKYLSKAQVIEKATQIITGIKEFSQGHPQINLVELIFRNQCDQNFYFVLENFKRSISDILKMHLKSKNPMKGIRQVNQLHKSKLKGELLKDQQKAILKHLKNDLQNPELLAQTFSQESIPMKFSSLSKALTEHFISTHVNKLGPLREAFTEADQDRDGIVSLEQFERILKDFKKGLEENRVQTIETLINSRQYDEITFSEAAGLFYDQPDQDQSIISIVNLLTDKD